MKRILSLVILVISISNGQNHVEKIVFTSDRAGSYDLWMMNPDGSNLEQLTSNQDSSDFGAKISPDGQTIAFQRGPVEGGYGWNLYLLDVVSGDERLFKHRDDFGAYHVIEPEWHPNGDLIYNVNMVASENIIRIASLNGSIDSVLIDHPNDKDDGATITPDGNMVIYRFDSGNWAYSATIRSRNLITEEDVQIFASDGHGHRDFCINSTGTKILWQSQSSSSWFGIESMNIDGSDIVELISNTNSESYSKPCWSPDDSEIVYGLGDADNRDIWMMDFDGTNHHMITNDLFINTSPEWGLIIDNSAVAYYPFNGHADDASGNSNDGVNNGATLARDRFEIENSAYSLDGIDDYIIVPEPSLEIVNELTVSAFVRITNSSTGGILIENDVIGTGNSDWHIGLTPDGFLTFTTGVGGTNYTLISDTTINNSLWRHIAVTRSTSGDLKIFLDGSQNSERSSAPGSIGNSSDLQFGCWNNAAGNYSFLQGTVDDVFIYNRALSAAEVASLYHLGGWPNTTSVEPELVSGFRLQQNYPNPFNPSTTISYSLPEASDVSMTIYDVQGREVVTLVQTKQSAGWYKVQWNGITSEGAQVSTGLYFARIEASSFNDVIKMVYLQ